MIIKLSIVLIYIIVMLTIGILSFKKSNNVSEFYISNRSAKGLASAFAYVTTYFSAVMFSMTGSLGYAYGMSIVWIGILSALFTGYLSWVLLAKKTRRLSEETKAITVFQMLETRFDSKFLGIFLPLVTLIFLIPYTASVYQGISYIFETTFNIPFNYCIIILAIITALYVSMGGNNATMFNSVFQGFFIVICVAIFYIYFFKNPIIGGISAGLEKLSKVQGGGQLASFLGGASPFALFTVMVVVDIGSLGMPTMITKFMAVKENAIKRSAAISGLSCFLIAGGMYFVGGFSRLFFASGAIAMPNTADKIMASIMMFTTNEYFSVMIFVMLLAAAMSTLAALVLTATSTLTEDILPRIIKSNTQDIKSRMALIRIFCVIFIAVSALLSIFPNPITSLLSISWGTIAATCIGPYFCGLFTENKSKTIPVISSVGGFAIMIAGVLKYGMGKATTVACFAILFSIVISVLGILYCNLTAAKNETI